jgi:hypothetical protein
MEPATCTSAQVKRLSRRAYETTKAETSIEDRVCDIRQDNILSSSGVVSQMPGLTMSSDLPGTETTEGRKHTNGTECYETENSDLGSVTRQSVHVSDQDIPESMDCCSAWLLL